MHIQTIPSDAVDVLIVDNDALTRQTLRRLLERRGYRCAEAYDGRHALTLARAEPPRCVLLGLLMGRPGSLAVARRLRADLRTFGTRIHCLTRQSQRVRELAQRAGLEEFLTQPVDGPSLQEIVGAELKWRDEVTAAVVSGLTKGQAEVVLDWLESHGCTGLVVTTEAGGFVVRCVCPAGFRMDPEEAGGLRLVPLATVRRAPSHRG
jgi:CheY-like chemotaxis protein